MISPKLCAFYHSVHVKDTCAEADVDLTVYRIKHNNFNDAFTSKSRRVIAPPKVNTEVLINN